MARAACFSASNMWVANAATVCPSADAADALAIAICHAHHRGTRAMLARMVVA